MTAWTSGNEGIKLHFRGSALKSSRWWAVEQQQVFVWVEKVQAVHSNLCAE